MHVYAVAVTYIIQVIIIVLFFVSFILVVTKQSEPVLWRRLRHLRLPSEPPRLLTRIFFINQRSYAHEHHALYKRAGFPLSFAYYILMKRAIVLFLSIGFALSMYYAVVSNKRVVLVIMPFIILLSLCLCEGTLLRWWVKRRQKLVIYDIYQLSYHLLYFSDSNMNIYSKLKRSLPYTTAIKRDVEILLIEWTQHYEYALDRFKQRLACHEAISFIDTIQALYQHQDEAFYDLLKERIDEYKEQLELSKENKKEISSYLLFILAGIPIIYTFQIFIYPWVKEVQALLMNMN